MRKTLSEREATIAVVVQGDTVHVETFTLAANDVAETVTPFKVTPGFKISYTIPVTNTGVMRIGATKAKAEGGTERRTVANGATVEVKLTNTAGIWFVSTVGGDIVEVVVEEVLIPLEA